MSWGAGRAVLAAGVVTSNSARCNWGRSHRRRHWRWRAWALNAKSKASTCSRAIHSRCALPVRGAGRVYSYSTRDRISSGWRVDTETAAGETTGAYLRRRASPASRTRRVVPDRARLCVSGSLRLNALTTTRKSSCAGLCRCTSPARRAGSIIADRTWNLWRTL